MKERRKNDFDKFAQKQGSKNEAVNVRIGTNSRIKDKVEKSAFG